MRLELLADPAEFLDAAADHLAAHPAVASVPASFARRRVDHPAGTRPDDWWLVVRDGSEVVGVGMRTAPFAPRPAYLSVMPDAAAVLLARTLHERGEWLPGVNGSLPAARLCAEETARLVGGTVEVSQQTRLWELGTPHPPPAVPGRLRPITEDDADVALTMEWFAAFARDADAQAGRPEGTIGHELPQHDDVLRRVRAGLTFFWEDETGTPVHLTSANPALFGVARVGPVYTPPEQRGRGWAAAAVHEVSVRFLAENARVTLFTDQANPTSNALYARLGFEPVVDLANHLVHPPHPAG